MVFPVPESEEVAVPLNLFVEPLLLEGVGLQLKNFLTNGMVNRGSWAVGNSRRFSKVFKKGGRSGASLCAWTECSLDFQRAWGLHVKGEGK